MKWHEVNSVGWSGLHVQCVYRLIDAKGREYVGTTSDLALRLQSHLRSNRVPFDRVLYAEGYGAATERRLIVELQPHYNSTGMKRRLRLSGVFDVKPLAWRQKWSSDLRVK